MGYERVRSLSLQFRTFPECGIRTSRTNHWIHLLERRIEVEWDVAEGKLFDVTLAEDVVLHRIRVSYEASAAGHTGKQVLEGILGNLG